MRTSVRVLVFSYFFLTAALALAQQAEPGARASETYDILGLKLGMTAQEAEAAIRDHLKLAPGPLPEGYRVDSTPRKYQGDGYFVDEFVITNPQMEVVVNFTEVYPGLAPGPEELYRITYTPRPLTDTEQADFVNRALAKFGPATLVRKGTDYIWVDRPYRSDQAAVKAGVPVLELNTDPLKLRLSNESIRGKMEDAFHRTKKLPL